MSRHHLFTKHPVDEALQELSIVILSINFGITPAIIESVKNIYDKLFQQNIALSNSFIQKCLMNTTIRTAINFLIRETPITRAMIVQLDTLSPEENRHLVTLNARYRIFENFRTENETDEHHKLDINVWQISQRHLKELDMAETKAEFLAFFNLPAKKSNTI